MEFKNILFPVDFSERCHRIAADVRETVKLFGSTLTLLHVVDYPGYHWYSEGEYIPEAPPAEIMNQAERKMKEFVRAEFSDMRVKSVIDQGDPGLCVVEMARAPGIDLVMMPTHGRGRFRALLMGSVAGQVLHDTSCPVWTSAHTESDITARATHWKSIVCAVDGESHSAELMRTAASLAAKYGTTVKLVHAIPTAASSIEAYYDGEFGSFLDDAARKAIADRQTEAGTNFPLDVKRGSVAGAIAEVVQESGAGLVLIGRGSVAKFAGAVRSSAYAIIRDSGCPVLSV